MRAVLLTIHLVGAVLWMGGLLTFSRLLGYQAKEAPSVRPRFTFVGGRLNTLVAWPGAALTVLGGLALIGMYGAPWFRANRWLHHKLSCVILALGIQLVLTLRHRRIRRDPPDARLPRGLFAALHGTTGLLLIAIIWLAIARP